MFSWSSMTSKQSVERAAPRNVAGDATSSWLRTSQSDLFKRGRVNESLDDVDERKDEIDDFFIGVFLEEALREIELNHEALLVSLEPAKRSGDSLTKFGFASFWF